MKTTKIIIRNLFGISELDLDGKSVELSGPKGSGKTSVLDSIRLALTNRSEEDAMTGEEIYKAYNEYAAALPVPEWAKAELAEAVAAGVTDGNNPCGMIPRYQAAIMALRAKKGGEAHE